MRDLARADYDHLEACGATLTADAGTFFERTYPIGDVFWNADVPAEKRFSMRLDHDVLAGRIPRQHADGIIRDRLRSYALRRRGWIVACRCGELRMTTTAILVRHFQAEGDTDVTGPIYAHLSPAPLVETTTAQAA